MAIDRRAFVGGGFALGALTSSPLKAQDDIGRTKDTETLFNLPYIDIDEWRDVPIRHRFVQGGFKGTEARFVMYLPPKDAYGGRFFQAINAVPLSPEMAANVMGGVDQFVSFCFDSGAAAVASNMGGFNATANPNSKADPTVSTYRVSAATARYARQIASEMYGPHRTYGYAFGGSGGGYRTIGCAQNSDAFDGVVPFMHPCPAAIPNGFAVRARGLRVLKDKLPQIADSVEPGGRAVAEVLNPDELAVYQELTKHGFPSRTWVFHETMGIGALAILYQSILAKDPGYFKDFWTVPGYLGKDRPDLFNEARLQHSTLVKRVILSSEAAAKGIAAPGRTTAGQTGDADVAWKALQNSHGGAALPIGLELKDDPPSGKSLVGANIVVETGPSAGKLLVLGGMQGTSALFQFGPSSGSLRDITDAIRAGHRVRIDNSDFLAFETYYRHALLGPDAYVCNQFRRADGVPMYPQRKQLMNYDFVLSSVGKPITGGFNGKMIVLQYLLDWDAHGWFADWYRNRIRSEQRAAMDSRYRLYFIDHCTHGQAPDPTRTVPYTGALQQALRDLSAWVERGVTPPSGTRYEVTDAQVVIASTAAARRGIQPVVTLMANGGVRADVSVGQPVKFTAMVEAPEGSGFIVAAEWDFAAGPQPVPGEDGRFQLSERIVPGRQINLDRTHTFDKPGVYYPALRVHSHRDGDAEARYARVANLGRVRVVVS
jgi:hypothetical protein